MAVLIAFGLAALAPISLPAQQAVDPQSLVGEWTGSYSQSGYRGTISLTVTRVEGNTIYGVAEVSAPYGVGTRDISGDNEGTLEGSTIRWRKLASWGEFTVNGKVMAGTIMAPSRTEVKLTKTK